MAHDGIYMNVQKRQKVDQWLPGLRVGRPVSADGRGLSSEGDGNVLKSGVGMVAQLYERTKNH